MRAIRAPGSTSAQKVPGPMIRGRGPRRAQSRCGRSERDATGPSHERVKRTARAGPDRNNLIW